MDLADASSGGISPPHYPGADLQGLQHRHVAALAIHRHQHAERLAGDAGNDGHQRHHDHGDQQADVTNYVTPPLTNSLTADVPAFDGAAVFNIGVTLNRVTKNVPIDLSNLSRATAQHGQRHRLHQQSTRRGRPASADESAPPTASRARPRRSPPAEPRSPCQPPPTSGRCRSTSAPVEDREFQRAADRCAPIPWARRSAIQIRQRPVDQRLGHPRPAAEVPNRHHQRGRPAADRRPGELHARDGSSIEASTPARGHDPRHAEPGRTGRCTCWPTSSGSWWKDEVGPGDAGRRALLKYDFRRTPDLHPHPGFDRQRVWPGPARSRRPGRWRWWARSPALLNSASRWRSEFQRDRRGGPDRQLHHPL